MQHTNQKNHGQVSQQKEQSLVKVWLTPNILDKF